MTLNGSIVIFFAEEIWCKWLQAFQVVLVVKNLPANTGDATRASLVAQLVKNQPAMREIWVWSLGWENPLEKGKATHSSILAWRISFVSSLVAQRVKCLSTMRETWVQSLGWEDPLEKEMATHSSTIAWKTPWTEEPGRLQSMGLQRVGHDWATSLVTFHLRDASSSLRGKDPLKEGMATHSSILA